jgi:hypothetical protein
LEGISPDRFFYTADYVQEHITKVPLHKQRLPNGKKQLWLCLLKIIFEEINQPP